MQSRKALPVILVLALAAGSALGQTPRADPGGATETPAPEPPRRELRTRLFQVVMVKANGAGDRSTDELPPAARKAITDLEEFLPYKHYTLLDTALLRTARSATTLVKNAEGGEYEISLSYRPTDQPGAEIFVERFRVVFIPPSVPRASEMRPGTKGNESEMVLKSSAPKATTYIDTSFGMKVGETLVVGSSKLNGGKTALLFLVTAVP